MGGSFPGADCGCPPREFECVQRDVFTTQATVSPPISGPASPVSCTVTGTSCTLLNSVPAPWCSPFPYPPVPYPPSSFMAQTFSIVINGVVTVASAGGFSTGTFQLATLKTVVLFAPRGSRTKCKVIANCFVNGIFNNVANVTINAVEEFKTVLAPVCPPPPPSPFPWGVSQVGGCCG